MSSDEAFAADALFDAYRTARAAVVAETVKRNQVFLHLDNQVGSGQWVQGGGPAVGQVWGIGWG